jgi:hypothetical protein
MPRSRRPQTYKQRAYNQRRHYAAVNRGNKPGMGCLLPVLLLIAAGVLAANRRA